MIKAIYLNGFLSFPQATVEIPSRTTMLLGINGSGKTNAVRAIQLLYEGINGRLEKFINERGGMPELIFSGLPSHPNITQPDKITLEYVFDGSILALYQYPFKGDVRYKIVLSQIKANVYRFEIHELVTYQASPDRFVTLFEYDGSIGNGKIADAQSLEGETFITMYPAGNAPYASGELAIRDLAGRVEFSPLLALRKAIEDIRLYTDFNVRPDSPMRKFSESVSYDNALVNGGDNLARVLNQFSINSSTKFYEMLDWLKKVNPNFKDIRFNPFGQKILMTLIENGLNKAVNISNISDGTLRFLCQLAIFCNPNPGSLIVIDEPETGLHPDMLNSIATLIKQTSTQTPVVIATHSPQLLNHFNLNDVLVFEKDVDNQTVAYAFNASDFEGDEDADQPGRLWVRGLIGGKRW